MNWIRFDTGINVAQYHVCVQHNTDFISNDTNIQVVWLILWMYMLNCTLHLITKQDQDKTWLIWHWRNLHTNALKHHYLYFFISNYLITSSLKPG
jgi:hypothetical protein